MSKRPWNRVKPFSHYARIGFMIWAVIMGMVLVGWLLALVIEFTATFSIPLAVIFGIASGVGYVAAIVTVFMWAVDP